MAENPLNTVYRAGLPDSFDTTPSELKELIDQGVACAECGDFYPERVVSFDEDGSWTCQSCLIDAEDAEDRVDEVAVRFRGDGIADEFDRYEDYGRKGVID